jgi:hypothetical protein
VLSNLPEYEHNVQSPVINGTTDLVISSATKLRTKSLRNSAKRPKQLQHYVNQQEASTTKIDYEYDRQSES